MTDDDDTRIAALEAEITDLRLRLAAARREEAGGPFPDHALGAPDGGTIRLSQLFGDRKDLVVVHNMGTTCPYCTMWADGFNGVLPHLEDRAAFVVVSPDDPETQRAFAEGRGWRFRMLSAKGTTFSRDAGFEGEDGSPHPGVSTFRLDDDGGVVRVSRAALGPGDEFCAVWHLFGMLADGAGGWGPRFRYDAP